MAGLCPLDSVLRQKMTALELVCEIQKDEILELLEAQNASDALEASTEAPARTADDDLAEIKAEKQRADLADEKLGQGLPNGGEGQQRSMRLVE